MSGSISQQLEDLLHPQPKFLDPEDDGDETTKARVVEKFAEDDDEEEDGEGKLAPSSLRKQAVSLLSDSDSRYAGKAVSRKQLMHDMGASEEEEQDDDDDEEDEDDDDDAEDDNEEEAEEEEEELQESEIDDDLNDDGEDLNESEVTFPKGGDFRKLTEGMDDLGMSEGEEDEGQGGSCNKAPRGRPRRQDRGTKRGRDQDAASDVELEERKWHAFDDLDRVRELQRNRIQFEKVEDESEGDDVESSEEDDMDPDDSTVRTFSQDKVSEEVEKGLAVKNQLALWDQLLEGRIKFQKAVVSANQLPQPSTFSEFKRNAEYAGALKNSHKALKALQRSLLELHDELLVQNVETRGLSLEQQSDEEILSDEENCDAMENVKPQKRKLEMAEYPDIMSKRFAAFTPYQNATLQKWHDKTRLTMGKTSKAFGAFERNILTQIEQVLLDKDRLIKRTQTRRSEYQVMGKKEGALASESATLEEEEPEKLVKTNMHLKDLDEDIFDDDDFYHQLLRELIERKTSAVDPNDQVAMGKQWLAIQKLRSKIKKKVDTKASKGRKVRFHIHSKLVNFMAPMHHSDMTDEAKSELYRGLFGQNLIRE